MTGIAITGMSCLFPGAPDLDAYWRNILGKVDATSDPPPEAWDPDVYYDPEFSDPDRTYCKRGGYLGSLASFDPLAHGVPPVTVGGEPDQWLALRVAQAALDDAGATDLPDAVRARTAVILGKGTYLNGGNAIAVQRGLVIGQTLDLIRRLHPEHSEEDLEDLRREMQRVLPPLGPDTVPGLIPNIIVGRIANRLDLMGPTYTVDAACASSLVAVRLAVRDLLTGECDLALAGGAQVWMPVATLNLFCRLGALSRRQQLRPFDKNADGTLLGEGIGMVVLKRLDDAVRDGDRVYALIRGVGVASDGRGMSVMAPRVDGEELALRRAYAEAGVSPRTVGLVEAHGTGTLVGDAVEIEALSRVFGERDGEAARCAVGSVKSMISHTIPAAGVAGLIKTALALHHRVLPPTLHCDEPNPALGLERTPFYVNTETRPWIHGGTEPRRAGINAFGFGGINAHAVVEEYDGAPAIDHRPPWDTELCVLEAESRPALADAARRLAAALGADPPFGLTDLAFTLSRALGQAERPLRLAIVASSLEDLRRKLEQATEKLVAPGCRRIKSVSGIYYDDEPLGRNGKIVFVFPGEGAQYPNMVADVCLHFADARAVFDRVDRLYAGHPRGDLLSDWVFPRPAASESERRIADERLMQLDIAVESVLTANAALHAVVSRLVRRTDAVVGHSTGEHSAALVTGVLDVDTDERLIAFSQGLYRAYADAAARHDVPGAVLLALGADAARAREIAAEAGGELHLAMDNCPHQAVLVGEPEAAHRARAIAGREGLVCEVLPYDRAVHTPLFAPFADDLRAVFAGLPVQSAPTRLWSCTTAAPYPDDPAAVRELLVEHWTRPVRFRETIDALYEDGARVFVEVGPRGNLTAFVEDILRGRRFCAVAADHPRRPGVTQLNHLAGLLMVHDVETDLGELFRQRRAREIDWQAPRAAVNGHGAHGIPLSTAWPMIRLAPDVVERLRPRPAPAPAEPIAVPVAANPVVDGDGVTGAVDQHLRTMEQFLEANEQVMQAYLTGGATAAVEERELPLVGTVVDWQPGIQLVARRILDPAEDRYLLDHTLGRTVARTDPELHALALMPLAMSLEIVAEAAATLVPERIVIGLRDVRAHRWLACGDGPQTLEATARRVTPDEVRVELRDLDESDRPCVEATVRLGDRYPTPPAPAAAPLDASAPSRLDPVRLYEEAMFHGPAWQAVRAMDVVAPAGAVARLETRPRAGLLRSTPHPAFVFDPVVLDAAGQVIGFWAAERLDRAKVVFPFRLAALDVYGPPLPEQRTLACTAAIELVGDALVRSDIHVLDPEGRCRLRLAGWEDRRFDVPERFRPLTRPSALEPLSAPWEAPIAGHSERAIACRRLDARLPADAALWKRVWAGRVLGRHEREHFGALRAPEGRQLEWLGARTAAKEALAGLLRARDGLDLLPADIEILPDERGCPRVHVAGVDPAPLVSLAHAQGETVAFAALAPPGTVIGIDIEHLRARPEGFAEAAFSADERGRLPAEATDEWLLRCWCAKEAAGKAVGSGLAPPAAVTAVDIDRGHVELATGARRLLAHTRREADLIVATVLCEEAVG
jgi:acyl transferase domain-containing protein/phosphopantetheinyl transferase (holo-ACP synthase)